MLLTVYSYLVKTLGQRVNQSLALERSLTVFQPPAHSERTPAQLVVDKIKEQLQMGAKIIQQIDIPPVLKAKIAVLIIQNATSFISNVNANSLAKIWTPSDRNENLEHIRILKTAFSLTTEVLNGFRETEPEFVLNYAIIKNLFHNRLPVVASDLKDTLATFIETSTKSKNSSIPQRPTASFRGVKKAIDELLKISPVFIITGDTHPTVMEHFLLPNKWVEEVAGKIVAKSECAKNLSWLPRTGMEIVEYSAQNECFERRALVPGIKKAELPIIINILKTTFDELNVIEHFKHPDRCYAHLNDRPPGSFDQRAGVNPEEFSLAFFPAGRLVESARAPFKADPKNAALLELIVSEVNRKLELCGLTDIAAKRGGTTTVDIVTSDKGRALQLIKEQKLSPSDFVVFFGDKIALSGNDVEAIYKADLSVQVGSEWDPNLYSIGDRPLIRSKRSAAEGGAADFITIITSYRKLGLTGILASDILTNSSHRKSQNISLPPINRNLTRDLANLNKQLTILTAGEEVADSFAFRSAAKRLPEILGQIPLSAKRLQRDPLVQFELALLNKVVEGGNPIIASDLKDTLAVFDANGVEWFPNTKDTFMEALKYGTYILITGDSAFNLQNHFLVPAGILSKNGKQLSSPISDINNLFLITRTGLDHLDFDFQNNQIKRSPLVAGISTSDIELITKILQRTTALYAQNLFGDYKIDADKPAGHIEIRGREYGNTDISFAYFPAGVLQKQERARFRESMMSHSVFAVMAAHIRGQLQQIGLDNILVQQGGISTIDLTTTTKGTALAQIKKQLAPNDFIIYLGDTITQKGNDASTVGVANITVQVGHEIDSNIYIPPDCQHFHSLKTARQGGTAEFLAAAIRAKKLAALNLWS